MLLLLIFLLLMLLLLLLLIGIASGASTMSPWPWSPAPLVSHSSFLQFNPPSTSIDKYLTFIIQKVSLPREDLDLLGFVFMHNFFPPQSEPDLLEPVLIEPTSPKRTRSPSRSIGQKWSRALTLISKYIKAIPCLQTYCLLIQGLPLRFHKSLHSQVVGLVGSRHVWQLSGCCFCLVTISNNIYSKIIVINGIEVKVFTSIYSTVIVINCSTRFTSHRLETTSRPCGMRSSQRVKMGR